MATPEQVKIAVERVINLVTAFGWEKVEERLENDTITIIIKKKITPLKSE